MVSYLGIFVAALASFIIGALWYGPVFGKVWMRLAGIAKSDMKRMNLSPVAAMSLGFVVSLVTAYVLSVFIDMLGIFSWAGASTFAVLAWVGLVAPVQLGAFLWEGKPFSLFVLNTAYNLLVLIVMTGILSVYF